MIYNLTIFLILNFGALALGSFFTRKAVTSQWYINLKKAPWTPPGWVFGSAWTIIMICFSFYITFLWPVIENKNFLLTLFVAQWVLNIGWNPTFFYLKKVLAGLIIIAGLTLIIGFFLLFYWSELGLKSALIFPYFIWLVIATSLNVYIYLNN
jgi:tryptophan-rich sensory protein